eukprot:gene20746-28461_t
MSRNCGLVRQDSPTTGAFFMPNMPMFSMESDEDDTKPAATAEPRNSYLEEKAFKSRTLLIFGTISDSVAADVTRRLIALDADSADKPIDILVSSPG